MPGRELKQAKSRFDQLIERGFCVFEGVLTEPLLSRLKNVTNALCEAVPPEGVERRAQGRMMSAMADPMLADLIALQPALDCLAAMGFRDPTFTDGYVISKPPHSPPLFWHYDWFAWRDPGAYDTRPQQVFFMYYLTDTSPGNGCLRVLPGSHREHNPVHDHVGNPHAPALSRAEDLSHPAFSTRPDEVDVPVGAGDLVIGDARLLHSAHGNTSPYRRTVITLWFQPDFCDLPERVQAQMVQKTQQIPLQWPADAAAKVRALQPRYDGDAQPYGRDLYRRRTRSDP